MKVALTGATGFIGSHILAELLDKGHEVTALVRGDDQADAVASRGATPAVVDLHDRIAVVSLMKTADGAVHTAHPGDATNADLDAAVVDAAIESFEGTGNPYVHISGIWIYGANSDVTEESPFNPPPLVAWKPPIERRVLDARDMRGVVIVSSAAYGDGAGSIPSLLLSSPRDDAGNLIMLGSGAQHWSTVHVADLASLFRSVLESPSAHGRYIAGDGLNPTVAEMTAAAASPSALRELSPVPRTRLAAVWATTSRKYCCSIRPPRPQRLEPSSIGSRPAPASSRSSGAEVTAQSPSREGRSRVHP